MISNEEFYKEEYRQLTEDWRNRDRMTWQMPAFLVVIGGILIVSALSQLGNDPNVKNAILLIGLLFNWVFTIFLTRNLYLQGLGQKLLDEIRDTIINDKRGCWVEIMERARRIPLHNKTYGFWSACGNFFTTISSVCLLLLVSSAITGFFAYFLLDSSYGFRFLWGFLVSWINIVLVFSLSHKFLNKIEIVKAKDWKSKLCRVMAFLVIVLFAIVIIMLAYFLTF